MGITGRGSVRVEPALNKVKFATCDSRDRRYVFTSGRIDFRIDERLEGSGSGWSQRLHQTRNKIQPTWAKGKKPIKWVRMKFKNLYCVIQLADVSGKAILVFIKTLA